MADKAPQGGIRRSQFMILVGGQQITPHEINLRVYKDHQIAPDSVLSAEANANIQAAETGIFRYSYSVAGIAAGTHLLEEIRVRVLPTDPLSVWYQVDAIVEGVFDNTVSAPASDSITLKITGGSC